MSKPRMTEADILDLELPLEDVLLCEEIFYKDELEKMNEND